MSFRPLWLAFLLAASACAAPGDAPSEEGESTPSATPTQDSSPTPTATPSPRIQGLHLFRDGCASELWARWRSGDDYALDAFQVLTEAGATVSSVTYFDLAFLGGMDEVWRFFDGGSFPDSRYRVRFLFGDGTEHEETLDLDASFFTGPALLAVTNVVADGPDGGLAVYVSAEISGSVQRVIAYDANRCPVFWKTFFSEPQLSSGSTTRLDVGGNFASGEELLLTVEGVDYGADYTYYTTALVTVP